MKKMQNHNGSRTRLYGTREVWLNFYGWMKSGPHIMRFGKLIMRWKLTIGKNPWWSIWRTMERTYKRKRKIKVLKSTLWCSRGHFIIAILYFNLSSKYHFETTTQFFFLLLTPEYWVQLFCPQNFSNFSFNKNFSPTFSFI